MAAITMAKVNNATPLLSLGQGPAYRRDKEVHAVWFPTTVHHTSPGQSRSRPFVYCLEQEILCVGHSLLIAKHLCTARGAFISKISYLHGLMLFWW